MPDVKPSGPQSRKPAVLIACSNATHREIYASHLRSQCHVDAVAVTTAKRAIEAATQRTFACALIDTNLPDADGVQLAALIRLQRYAKTTPLIFILGNNADPRFVRRCYRLGAVDVLAQRPADPQILVQKAKVYVQLFRKQKELQTEVSHVKGENRELIQERREFLRLQENLRHQATHDPLTKLPNRILFSDRFVVAAKHARRSKHSLAVAFIDLDKFKAVNDAHGHETGDQVLRRVSRRLSSALRATDTVARLGGDEFGVVLETLETAQAAATLAEKIHRAVTKPVRTMSSLQGKRVEIKVGASIGVALLPDHGIRLQELINRAEKMMYDAKKAGGGVRVDASERRKRKGTKVEPLRERRQGSFIKAIKNAQLRKPAQQKGSRSPAKRR